MDEVYIPGDNTSSWIILSIVLTILAVTFMILWIICLEENKNKVSNVCFGSFGVQTGIDGVPLGTCGTNRTTSCVFSKNTLADAETECNNLASICNTFTFNFSTSTMKIIDPNNTFTSIQSNLFKRQ